VQLKLRPMRLSAAPSAVIPPVFTVFTVFTVLLAHPSASTLGHHANSHDQLIFAWETSDGALRGPLPPSKQRQHSLPTRRMHRFAAGIPCCCGTFFQFPCNLANHAELASRRFTMSLNRAGGLGPLILFPCFPVSCWLVGRGNTTTSSGKGSLQSAVAADSPDWLIWCPPPLGEMLCSRA